MSARSSAKLKAEVERQAALRRRLPLLVQTSHSPLILGTAFLSLSATRPNRFGFVALIRKGDTRSRRLRAVCRAICSDFNANLRYKTSRIYEVFYLKCSGSPAPSAEQHMTRMTGCLLYTPAPPPGPTRVNRAGRPRKETVHGFFLRTLMYSKKKASDDVSDSACLASASAARWNSESPIDQSS